MRPLLGDQISKSSNWLVTSTTYYDTTEQTYGYWGKNTFGN
jgi:hypothetical protein